MHLDTLIIKGMVEDQDYFHRVIPHIKTDYFHNPSMEKIVELSKKYVDKFNRPPNYSVLRVLCEKTGEAGNIPEEVFNGCLDILNTAESNTESVDVSWLLGETETYFRSQAVLNALAESIEIHERITKGKKDKQITDLGSIPEILTEALQVSFDTSTGHDWLGDAEERFMSYLEKVDKIPFDIDILNKATNGGVERGCLNILLMPTNSGKSLGLVHLGRHYAMNLGLHVVYCSFEMGENVVGKRVDAGALKMSMDDFGLMTPKVFSKKIDAIKKKTNGSYHFKQFPTAGAHVGHVRNWLRELELKKGIRPDVIIIDYLGIMLSSRMKSSDHSYSWVKSIAEEVRGLLIEYNAVGWSAAQTNREGNNTLEIDLNHVGESAGLSHTVDFMLAGAETEELAQQQKQLFRQLKSRYGDKNKYKSFLMGVDKNQQRWFDASDQPVGDAVSDAAIEQSYGTKDALSSFEDDDVDSVKW